MAAIFSRSTQKAFNGNYPSIAVNSSSNIVCIYNFGVVKFDIYYAVGHIKSDGRVEWGPEKHFRPGSYPKIATNDAKKVVVVYTHSNTIKCRIGVMAASGDSISWNDEFDICSGKYPSIAMAGNSILLAYQVSGNCRYCFGQLDEATVAITWSQRHVELAKNASCPSVSISNDLAIATFNGVQCKISSRVGKIEDNTITWNLIQESRKFSGLYPCVAMFEEGRVVVVYQHHADKHYFVTWSGKIDAVNGAVKWRDQEETIESGRNPSVAVVKSAENIPAFIEIHGDNVSSMKWERPFHYHFAVFATIGLQ